MDRDMTTEEPKSIINEDRTRRVLIYKHRMVFGAGSKRNCSGAA